MKRDIGLFIGDILDNIGDIESFSKGLTEEEFMHNKLKQNAIIRSLEIIGEAVKNVPDSFKEKHSEIPWRKIAEFRDILSHSYFGVSLERVWNVVEKELPELKEAIKK